MGLAYDSKSIDINVTATTFPRGIFFNPDGTKMYVVTQDTAPVTNDYIYQYTLETPWDVSTATYDEVRISTDSNSQGIFFNADGDKMFVVRANDIEVKAYTLSSSWDLSTASIVGYKSVSAQDSSPRGVFFNPDGNIMYVTGLAGGDVNQYTLGTPWVLSTANYSKNYTLSEITNVQGIFFNSDGTKMYVAGYNGTKAIYLYTLSTGWDVATATYDKNYPVDSEDIFPIGIFIKSDNSKLYISGGEHDKVYQYSLSPDIPTVTTQAVSDIGDVTAIGNGNITDLGGDTPTKRGICYNKTGSPTVADSKTEETGEFETGAFTETLINLSPETLYYAKAYAMNVAGYGYGSEVSFTTKLVEWIGYGEWVKFVTAAPGETGDKPLGYKNDVCSDNSGYTYILNRSLLDDGVSYKSHFVLSTDLSGKKTLHTNKRLLDIFSYFANKGTGTAKVYVKRDTEPEWQEAGEISLTGKEEIVIQHIPVDYLAKTYLIKFTFENDFEFIGSIFESIPIGDR